MAEMWKCPDCPREFDTSDPVFPTAVASHMKGHGKTVTFSKKGHVSGRKKDDGRSDVAEDVIDIAVDAVMWNTITRGGSGSSGGSGGGGFWDWLPFGKGDGGGKSSGGGGGSWLDNLFD